MMRWSATALFLALIAAISHGDAFELIGGPDVRIGADQGSTDARSAIFDFDPGTGNYFAVVEWDGSWTFNVSTDSGATWTRTYRYNCSEGMAGLDMAISPAGVYVGYACNIASQRDQAKMRRFLLDTGTLDSTYTSGGELVLDTDPSAIVDISLETNIDTDGDRIYYALIQSDGATRVLWDVPSDGTAFGEDSPGIGNADDGLDLHWNPGATADFLYLSLVDLTGEIQVWGYDGSWGQSTSFAYSGSQTRTSISAFGDQVVVAYLDPAAFGQGVAYRQSTDGGATWEPPWTIAEPEDGQGDFFDVAISARGGNGLGLVYNLEAGDIDLVLFQSKPTYDPSRPWRQAGTFNDIDSFTDLPIALGWTPSDLYAVIYVGGADRIPYFDRVESLSLFADGLETGDTSFWQFSTHPLP